MIENQAAVVVICTFLSLLFLLIGWMWGNSKKGFMVDRTNELPDCLYTVIYTDKICTVIREVGIKKRNFLITTNAFGCQPIRPKDTIRKAKDWAEMKSLGIASLGYTPFIKEEVAEA